jgi:hypothetical protein
MATVPCPGATLAEFGQGEWGVWPHFRVLANSLAGLIMAMPLFRLYSP